MSISDFTQPFFSVIAASLGFTISPTQFRRSLCLKYIQSTHISRTHGRRITVRGQGRISALRAKQDNSYIWARTAMCARTMSGDIHSICQDVPAMYVDHSIRAHARHWSRFVFMITSNSNMASGQKSRREDLSSRHRVDSRNQPNLIESRFRESRGNLQTLHNR